MGGDSVDGTVRTTVREVQHGYWMWHDTRILIVIKNIQVHGSILRLGCFQLSPLFAKVIKGKRRRKLCHLSCA